MILVLDPCPPVPAHSDKAEYKTGLCVFSSLRWWLFLPTPQEFCPVDQNTEYIKVKNLVSQPSNYFCMLQDYIKILSCSGAGKYWDIWSFSIHSNYFHRILNALFFQNRQFCLLLMNGWRPYVFVISLHVFEGDNIWPLG